MLNHPSWEKMLATGVLSRIENSRKQKKVYVEKYNVDISDISIFSDLEYIFSNIDGYKTFYIKLFEDMATFNFKNTSSVTDNNDDLVTEFVSVKLYEHLFNTFKQMIEIVSIKNYSAQKDLYLIIALLHDFGKSHSLCDFYNIDLNEKHHIRSAVYFKTIIEENDNYFGIDQTSFQIIFKTLSLHHSFRDDKESTFLASLIEADSNARKLEETKQGDN